MMEDRDIQRVKEEAPVTRLEVRVEDEEKKTIEIETASEGQQAHTQSS